MVHHKHYINFLTGLHLAFASVLLYKPELILEQDAVQVLGQAMGMPPVPDSMYSSAGFAGLALLVLAMNDLLVQMQASELFKRQFWRVQAPFRASFFMALVAWMYLMKPARSEWLKASWEVRNRLVFTWAFIEVIAWYFIFGGLRDEGRRIARSRKDAEPEE